MNKQRRQALYRILDHAAHDEQFADDVELLRPLLEPRYIRAKSITPRRDQLPLPETIFADSLERHLVDTAHCSA